MAPFPPISRRGAYLVVAALGLSALLAAGAAVLEGRWRALTEAQAATASQAAAHAAAVALAHGATLDEARALAAAVAGQNRVGRDPADVDPLQDVVFGTWDFEARRLDPTAPRVNAVEVRVRPPGDPLRWLLGSWTQPEQGAARTALRSRDVVVALDLVDPAAADPAVLSLADRLAFLALPDERLAVVQLDEFDASDASSWLGGERPFAARVLVVVSDRLCQDPIRLPSTRALVTALGDDGVHVVPIAVGDQPCLAELARGFGRPAAVPTADTLPAALADVAWGAPIAVVSP